MVLTIQLFRAGPCEGSDGLLAQVIEPAADGSRRVIYAVETSRSGQTDKVWLKATAEAFCRRPTRRPYVLHDCTGVPDAPLLVRLKERDGSGRVSVAWEGPLGDFYVDNADVYDDEGERDELERSLYFNGAAAVAGGAHGDAWLEAVQFQPGEHG
jgi:hypothetical protein